MILVENKVIIAVFSSYQELSNGKLINGSIYPFGEIVDVESASEVVPQKYCYTAENGFYLNAEYHDPIVPMEEMQKSIDELKTVNAQLVLAMVVGGLL